MADKLLIAADEYEILKLKVLCEKKLIEQLSLNNLHKALQFVDKFNTTILENAVIQLIVNNAVGLRFMHEFITFLESLSSILLSKVIYALMEKFVS